VVGGILIIFSTLVFMRWTAIMAAAILDDQLITVDTVCQLPPLFENLDQTIAWIKGVQSKDDPVPGVVLKYNTYVNLYLIFSFPLSPC